MYFKNAFENREKKKLCFQNVNSKNALKPQTQTDPRLHQIKNVERRKYLPAALPTKGVDRSHWSIKIQVFFKITCPVICNKNNLESVIHQNIKIYMY